MEWTLVIFIYAGILASGDSVALTALPGWNTKASCEQAGKELQPLVKKAAKELRFVCVKR